MNARIAVAPTRPAPAAHSGIRRAWLPRSLRAERSPENASESCAGTGAPGFVQPHSFGAIRAHHGSESVPIAIGRVAQPGPALLQRSVQFEEGRVEPKINAAEAYLSKGSFAGLTTPVINRFELDFEAQQKQEPVPIEAPMFSSSGLAPRCRIAELGENVGHADELVLSPGPWTVTMPKPNVWLKLGFQECKSRPGLATVTADGSPDHATLEASVRIHEDRHVSDTRQAFGDVIGGWDDKLKRLGDSRKWFRGDGLDACKAAAFAAAGGTPEQVGAAFTKRVLADSEAFHSTPSGRFIKQRDAGVDPECDAPWVRLG